MKLDSMDVIFLMLNALTIITLIIGAMIIGRLNGIIAWINEPCDCEDCIDSEEEEI